MKTTMTSERRFHGEGVGGLKRGSSCNLLCSSLMSLVGCARDFKVDFSEDMSMVSYWAEVVEWNMLVVVTVSV